jgi:transcriptional regulator with XRE-family HTH domain
MARAQSTPTVTSRQLGKHLRAVRRRRGLSLSEVARSAGLTRRELVSYERGKVAIPESDLWCLAGSCGVDIAELIPPTPNDRELEAGNISVGETVAQLRRSTEDDPLRPYLGTLSELQALPAGSRVPVRDRDLAALADALGRDPALIERRLVQVMHVSPDEAARIRAMILPPLRGRRRARALAAGPAPTPDALDELVRLPAPLAPEAVEESDALAPPEAFAAPAAAVADDEVAYAAVVPQEVSVTVPASDRPAPTNDWPAPPSDWPEPAPEWREAAAAWPEPAIDWPARATGDDGPTDLFTEVSPTADPDQAEPEWPQPDDAWEVPAGWERDPAPGHAVEGIDPWPADAEAAWALDVEAAWRAPDDTDTDASTPEAFWSDAAGGWPPVGPGSETAEPEPTAWATEAADAWTTDAADAWTPEQAEPWSTEPADSWSTESTGVWAGEPASAWTPDPEPTAWTPDPEPTAWTPDPEPTAWTPDPEPTAWTPDAEDPVPAPSWSGWTHEPDPAATSTGFYVDWDPMADAKPAATPVAETVPGWSDPDATDAADADGAGDDAVDDGPAPISWRPEWFEEPAGSATPVDEPADETAPAVDQPTTEAEETHEVAPPTVEDFVVAGPDWLLGNSVPLVEVAVTGGLVLRRADERWALADVTAGECFALEVDLDFRSGPGFGILFRADVDDSGRMSGYSFDVDPVYDGGGYLVRQWEANRELWNPIAHVAAADPTTMHGRLTVRLVVTNERLVASVNGVDVLSVENLKQASADRGREAAGGARVGVQAWSSSDLVIETLRVAAH